MARNRLKPYLREVIAKQHAIVLAAIAACDVDHLRAGEARACAAATSIPTTWQWWKLPVDRNRHCTDPTSSGYRKAA